MPAAASRILVTVNSSATIARHPEVPNLIAVAILSPLAARWCTANDHTATRRRDRQGGKLRTRQCGQELASGADGSYEERLGSEGAESCGSDFPDELGVKAGDELIEGGKPRDGEKVVRRGDRDHGFSSVDFKQMLRAGEQLARDLHAYCGRRDVALDGGEQDATAPVKKTIARTHHLRKESHGVFEVAERRFFSVSLLDRGKEIELDEKDIARRVRTKTGFKMAFRLGRS